MNSRIALPPDEQRCAEHYGDRRCELETGHAGSHWNGALSWEQLELELDDQLECLDRRDTGGCAGPVEYRHALSGTGVSFPRCDRHWAQRLEQQEQITARYPYNAPADFDPAYAGERWEDDY